MKKAAHGVQKMPSLGRSFGPPITARCNILATNIGIGFCTGQLENAGHDIFTLATGSSGKRLPSAGLPITVE
jgi:hypothetical protein